TDILENLGISLAEIKDLIEKKIRTDRKIDLQAEIVMLKSTEKTLKLVYLEARSFKSATVNSGHLLLAILKDSDSIVTQILVEFGVNYYMVRNQIQDYKEDVEAKSDFPEGDDDDTGDDFTRGPIRQQPGQKKGP